LPAPIKYTYDDVLHMVDRMNAGESVVNVGKSYGVSREAIYQLMKNTGFDRKHSDGKWKPTREKTGNLKRRYNVDQQLIKRRAKPNTPMKRCPIDGCRNYIPETDDCCAPHYHRWVTGYDPEPGYIVHETALPSV